MKTLMCSFNHGPVGEAVSEKSILFNNLTAIFESVPATYIIIQYMGGGNTYFSLQCSCDEAQKPGDADHHWHETTCKYHTSRCCGYNEPDIIWEERYANHSGKWLMSDPNTDRVVKGSGDYAAYRKAFLAFKGDKKGISFTIDDRSNLENYGGVDIDD